jgi:hypothetical protein
MKIYEGQDLIVDQIKRNAVKSKKQNDDFKSVFDQVASSSVENSKVSGKTDQLPVMSGIQIIGGTEQINDLGAGEKGSLVGALKETLNLVDFYADKLGDSSLSATGLSPLVDHLEERLEMLRGIESDQETPDKLKGVLSDLKMTIGKEIEKYRRGDYL